MECFQTPEKCVGPAARGNESGDQSTSPCPPSSANAAGGEGGKRRSLDGDAGWERKGVPPYLRAKSECSGPGSPRE